jgi:hypothetical protein
LSCVWKQLFGRSIFVQCYSFLGLDKNLSRGQRGRIKLKAFVTWCTVFHCRANKGIGHAIR